MKKARFDTWQLGLTGRSTRMPTWAMKMPKAWPMLVPSALRRRLTGVAGDANASHRSGHALWAPLNLVVICQSRINPCANPFWPWPCSHSPNRSSPTDCPHPPERSTNAKRPEKSTTPIRLASAPRRSMSRQPGAWTNPAVAS